MTTEVPKPTLDLSPDQERALTAIDAWMGSTNQILTFGGFAGTGKTTLIKEVVSKYPHANIVAFTGKAVSVLRRKGVGRAQTLHSLLYTVLGENDDGDPIFQARTYLDGVSLVIVDEASMINRYMHNDLEAAAPKILYVGDHGQLEPIGYDPGLMKEPTIRLEKIHRQAGDSAILRFAHKLRTGMDPFDWYEGGAEYQETEDEVQLANRWPKDIEMYDSVLCGFNGTRHYLNKVIRQKRGFSGVLPNPGERLICIHNHRGYGIFNGLHITVDSCEQLDSQEAAVHWTDFEGKARQTLMYLPQLGSSDKHSRDEHIRETYGLFDWGYAMTVHKAQGSEWDHVCVVEGLHGSWNAARWRYTASTRAAKSLTYVVEKRRLPWEVKR